MRLDLRLVADRLAPSRSRAKDMVRAGAVAVDGVVIAKPGQIVDADATVALVKDYCPWVSRAGLKLAHALDRFGLSPRGATVLDLGASTGGFTEVCLERRARRVYAVDVGHGQLHERLRDDPRVVALEGVNARAVDAALVPEPIDFFTADLAFISLSKALPAPLALAAPGAVAVLLVKPQFEVGPALVGKGGVVRDAAARDTAAQTVAAALKSWGWTVIGEDVSPILGGDGNEERLLAARR